MLRKFPKSPVTEPAPRKEQILAKTLITGWGTLVLTAAAHPIVAAVTNKPVIALRTVSACEPHIVMTGNGIHCMDGSATMGNSASFVDTCCVMSVKVSEYLVGKFLPLESLAHGFAMNGTMMFPSVFLIGFHHLRPIRQRIPPKWSW